MTLDSADSQKKKKWISDEAFAEIRGKKGKQKAKIKADIKN